MRTPTAAATILLTLITAMARAEEPERAASHRPVFTPDGRGIVFMSNRHGGDWELFRMQLDGSGLQRLTEHAGWDGYADLAPDGIRLAFDRGDGDTGRMILLNLETRREQVLAKSVAHLGGPRWHPHANQLIYQWERDGNRDLYLMNLDSHTSRRLTDTAVDEGDPTFAPDGRSIVMAISGDDGSALATLSIETGERALLVESTGRIYGTAWSPDGEWLAYNDDADGDAEIYLIRPDGSDRQRLTDNTAPDHLPVFSPDGGWIMFTSERNGVEEIFVTDRARGVTFRLATR